MKKKGRSAKINGKLSLSSVDAISVLRNYMSYIYDRRATQGAR